MTADEFRALYDQSASDLLGFLLRRAESPEDAADCLAETFLIAWDRQDHIPSSPSQARPWLFGVARNVLRRDRKRNGIAAAAVTALADELQRTPNPAPIDDRMALALGRLSAVDREIIEMLAWDELAPREVAAILDLSPNVVRIRAHRARLKLREDLKSYKPVWLSEG